MLEAMIREILGVAVTSLHTDISTRTGERIIVFTLEHRPRFVPEPPNRRANGRGGGVRPES
jgi:uncharacterized protein YbcI